MTGLIWFVQVVHYPLFGAVGDEHFQKYVNAHCNLTGMVVILPMVAQLGLSALLALTVKSTVPYLFWINLGMVAVIWAMTATCSIPCHGSLCANGYDATVHGQLVFTNWARTILWSTCSIVMAVALAEQMK